MRCSHLVVTRSLLLALVVTGLQVSASLGAAPASIELELIEQHFGGPGTPTADLPQVATDTAEWAVVWERLGFAREKGGSIAHPATPQPPPAVDFDQFFAIAFQLGDCGFNGVRATLDGHVLTVAEVPSPQPDPETCVTAAVGTQSIAYGVRRSLVPAGEITVRLVLRDPDREFSALATVNQGLANDELPRTGPASPLLIAVFGLTSAAAGLYIAARGSARRRRTQLGTEGIRAADAARGPELGSGSFDPLPPTA